MTVLERKDAPIESTWKKETVYANWDECEKEFEQALAELPQLTEYNGRLKEGPSVLADWFELYQKHWERVMILTSYVRWASNVDSSDPDAKRFIGQASSLESQFRAAAAFMDPQLLEIGETLHTWADQEPRLKIYTHYFDNLLRLQKHQRSEEVEQLLSLVDEPFSGVYQAFSELANTDLKFQPAVDSQGEEHPTFQASIFSSRTSPDRKRRQTTWENYNDGYLSMQNTFAALYLANVKQHVFLAKTRNFDSVLELRLSGNNLPTTVFHNLIDVFKENLPLWQRYWDVKRRVMGLEEINSYDRWAPIQENPPAISYKQSVDWICDAMQPLGDDYVNIMRKGCLEDRWVDWAPNIEKRQGVQHQTARSGVNHPTFS
ncbi:MAG: oligoendopeptidase F family protein [Chloroflexi bacterium]|nr:oligoendopeptidase F family protein [Chloroflexota bacterium]